MEAKHYLAIGCIVGGIFIAYMAYYGEGFIPNWVPFLGWIDNVSLAFFFILLGFIMAFMVIRW